MTHVDHYQFLNPLNDVKCKYVIRVDVNMFILFHTQCCFVRFKDFFLYIHDLYIILCWLNTAWNKIVDNIVCFINTKCKLFQDYNFARFKNNWKDYINICYLSMYLLYKSKHLGVIITVHHLVTRAVDSMACRTKRFTVGRASRGARTRPGRWTRLPHPAYSCCFIG